MRLQSVAGLRKGVAMEDREAEKEAEENMSQAGSVASKLFGRTSPLMRKVDEEARVWESVMSMASIGSMGDVRSIASIPPTPGMTTRRR
jgi:ribosomal protein L9